MFAYNLWPFLVLVLGSSHSLSDEFTSNSSWSARFTHALVQTVLPVMHHGIAPCVPRQLKSTPLYRGMSAHFGHFQSCFRKRVMHIYWKVQQIHNPPNVNIHHMPTGTPAGFARSVVIPPLWLSQVLFRASQSSPGGRTHSVLFGGT